MPVLRVYIWKNTIVFLFRCRNCNRTPVSYTHLIACPDGVEVPFNIEAYVNGAYIVLGLLYGEGDFERTIDISTRAGQDSDCNPCVARDRIDVPIGTI